MTNAAGEFPWVATIQEPIAKEALGILRALIHEFDLGHSGTLRIGGYAHDTPEWAPIGREGHWRNKRAQVAEMLVNRGVLEAARSEFVGGYQGVGDESGDFLFVRADEQLVRRACQALEERVNRRARAPARRAHPGRHSEGAGGAPSNSPESRDAFGRSYRSTMGTLLAYLTIICVGVFVVFLLAKFVPGFGDWLISVLEAVSTKAA